MWEHHYQSHRNKKDYKRGLYATYWTPRWYPIGHQMDKLLEIHNPQRLNYKNVGNLKRPITNRVIESVIKNLH